MAAASGTTGTWETVTVVPPPVAHVWLVSFSPLTANGQKEEATAPETAIGHESGEGDRVTVSGHGDIPDEQRIVNAPVMIGSAPKNTTGHAESDPDKSGSGPKTATDLAETLSESERAVTDSGQKTATVTHKCSPRRAVVKTPGKSKIHARVKSKMAAKSQEGASGVINTARRERLKSSSRVKGCDGWVIAEGHR